MADVFDPDLFLGDPEPDVPVESDEQTATRLARQDIATKAGSGT